MLNDFGVSYNTINTFNPFLISMPVTFEPFQFLDTSIQNFTCERTKLTKEIQNKINQHKKYNNTNAGGKSEALDITMHGVYDIILVFWWWGRGREKFSALLKSYLYLSTKLTNTNKSGSFKVSSLKSWNVQGLLEFFMFPLYRTAWNISVGVIVVVLAVFSSSLFFCLSSDHTMWGGW